MSGLILDGIRLLKGATLAGPLACGTNAATMGALSSSSISNSGTLSTGATTISGTMSCGTNAATCGALTSSSISNSGTLSTGATTISGTLSCGTNSATCGALTATSVSAGPTASALTVGVFTSKINSVNRWTVGLLGTESSGNAGSNFMIHRYNDDGSAIDAPVTVTRSTGILNPVYGMKLPTSGGTASTLDYYEEGSFVMTVNGPMDTISLTVYFTRVGKMVTLRWNFTKTAANNNAINMYGYAGQIPARLCPTVQLFLPMFAIQGLTSSVYSSPAVFVIGTDGSITFALQSSTGFTAFPAVDNTHSYGMQAGAVSYTLN